MGRPLCLPPRCPSLPSCPKGQAWEACSPAAPERVPGPGVLRGEAPTTPAAGAFTVTATGQRGWVAELHLEKCLRQRCP